MPLSDSERRLRASIAGLTGWQNTTNRAARARHANRGIWQKAFDAADAGLPEHERAKIADTAYKKHLQRMTFNSLKARRLRAEERERVAAERKAARQAEQLDGGAA
jgi:hypothetical protein